MGKCSKSWVLLVAFFTFLAAGNAASAKTLTTDVVVIGAGGAGLSAALTAANAGAKVILLEKLSRPGGSTQYAEGLFAVESSIQRANNQGPTKDEAFAVNMEYNHWLENPRLVRAFIDKSAETIDWLIEQGVEFEGVKNNWRQGPGTWHVIKGRRGADLIKVLSARAQEKTNITIYYNTPAKKLVVDKQGRIVGVMAEDKERQAINITSKAVIISTGGFAENKEMLKKYTLLGPDIKPFGNTKKTGDGIRMAMEVGADIKGMSTLQLVGPLVPGFGLGTHLGAAGLQAGNLWVNVSAKRFCDEAIVTNFPYAGNAIAQQKDQTMFCIFDETAKKYMMEKGIDIGAGEFVPPATKLTNFEKEITSAISQNVAFAADSIESLAAKMGVDEKALAATVQAYNKYCDQGYDELFVKDRAYLRPVRTSRFYALKGAITFIGTLGGIKINEKTEVMNKNFDIIPGLYATGSCVGGLYGDSYDLFTSGGTFGFAINSGRMAGENAVTFIGGK